MCGFKFGKREYWENHVRYIHPIPGNDLEPIPADMPEVGGKDEASGSGTMENKKVDPVVINKVCLKNCTQQIETSNARFGSLDVEWKQGHSSSCLHETWGRQ